MHHEQIKFTNFKVIAFFAVEKETKYVNYRQCYRHPTLKQHSYIHSLFYQNQESFEL